MKMLHLIVDGTGTAAIREGEFDATLTDNGTGDYTITFNEVFVRKPIVVVTSATTGTYAHTVDASNTVSATRIKVLSDAGVATDAVIHVMIIGALVADEI